MPISGASALLGRRGADADADAVVVGSASLGEYQIVFSATKRSARAGRAAAGDVEVGTAAPTAVPMDAAGDVGEGPSGTVTAEKAASRKVVAL